MNELRNLNARQLVVYILIMLFSGAVIALAIITAITYLQGR